MGRLADVPLPENVRRPVLGAFAKAFGIDVSEASRPLEEYGSLNDFFVRRLKEGARRWPDGPGLATPVDGIVGQVGAVDGGRLLQAKGRSYSAAELLGDADEAARYEGGWFVTLYLSPRHYHRIHAPLAGTIPAARYVPGGLLPVNGPSVSGTEGLFVRNERLLCLLDGHPDPDPARPPETPTSRVALVAVGAYNVGRISAAFDPAWSGSDDRPWVTNRKDELPRERAYDPPVAVERGEEIMAFHLGSTVILLTEHGRWELSPGCRPGEELALGTLLARPSNAGGGAADPPGDPPPTPGDRDTDR
jgi:phosphatidylserine decarboxylase